MKIAHVVDSMEVGGAEMLILALCRQHRREGHEVSVHCIMEAGPLAETVAQEGIPLRVYGSLPYWRLPWSLYCGLRAVRPDVVHCHNVVSSVFGAPVGRLAGARGVICTRHGVVANPHNLRRQGLFWLAARFSDHVVAVCQRGEQNLARATFAVPQKLMTIRNGAEPAPGSRSGAEAIVKQGFTAVMVARLAQPKDHATLLRSVAIASRSILDLNLWVIGDGPKAPELQQLAARLGIEGRVRFLGERRDVGDWLARADLFVLSSQSEGVPISLLEALAAGLPVLVTDVGGMPEIAQLSGVGRAVPPGDPNEMAAGILHFAGQRDRRAELARLARQSYSQFFRPEQMASDYMGLYRSCLGQHSAAAYRERA